MIRKFLDGIIVFVESVLKSDVKTTILWYILSLSTIIALGPLFGFDRTPVNIIGASILYLLYALAYLFSGLIFEYIKKHIKKRGRRDEG